jgi:hypothetical protein
MAISGDPNDPNFGLETDPTHPNFGLPVQEATQPTQVAQPSQDTGAPPTMTGAEESGAMAQLAAEHPILESAATGLVGAVRGFIPTNAYPEIGLTDMLFPGASGVQSQIESIPQTVRQVQEAEQTPAWSPERFQAGFNVLGQMGMAALGARGISETLFPKPVETGELTTTLFPKLEEPPAIPPVPETPSVDAAVQTTARETVPEQLQPGEQNASQITSPEGVPVPTLREEVGGETPLRQPGEIAGARETGAPEVPTTAPQEQVAPKGFVTATEVDSAASKGLITPAEASEWKDIQTYEDKSKGQMEREAEIVNKVRPKPSAEISPSPTAEEAPEPGEVRPSPEPTVPNSPTSLKNAVVDQEREARGLPSVIQPARQSFGELWDRVSQKIDQNPNYPDEVIQSLKDNKRAMTAEEDAALLHRQVDLQNQYEKANQGVIDARATGDDTALSDASARSKALSDQLLEVYDIGRSGGRETALGLNARKLLAQEDFSLGNMITQKRADLMGAELTPEQTDQVTKQYNDINAKRIALDAYETSPRAEAYRKQLQNWTDQYRQKTAASDFAPQIRQKLLLDPEGQKLKADFERAKTDWQRARVADQAANRTPSQKFWDRFVGVERAMKLSSDVVLAKLTAAAGVRELGLTPAEQAVGSVTRQIIPGIAAKAPRYGGGFSLDSEINAKQQMFTQGMKDAWQNLKMKQTDLDELYKTGKIKAPDEFYDYMGYLHGALKAPIKRAEFARSLSERMKWAVRNGQDLNNQAVMRQLSEQAYVDANRSIFLQDNIVSKSMNLLNRYLETQKIAPNLGPALSRINRFLVPIVKIPTNIVGEVAEGVHGVLSGGTRAALAYMKGLSTLEPAQADLIMRQINKGLVGNALLLTGYLLRNNIGGFYHDQDKRTPADVQPGRYRIGGVDLPASAGHSTGAMLLNIGATVGRVAEEQQKKISPETKGIGEGLRAAGAGLAREVPFVPAVTGIADAMDSKGGFQKYINGMITSTSTPALLSHIAKLADTPGTFPQNALQEATKRKPTTALEALKMGIPGLRQQVPERTKPGAKTQKVSKFGGVITQ